eukprot:TRINITY_DN112509_c0_g1_i1.p1 TRINITY_DN112509_c0_g1~~TRINITY_DN112509_c0_g1_i1.p1  ORF type:complete len:156 (+),score=29.21 TRINITY_DN112509_c0_g1_i1:55-468(+)
MLPYFLSLPLLLAVSLALPAVQTLHALQQGPVKGRDDRKVWLFYWLCMVGIYWMFWCFEWAIQIPFLVLSFFVDIYYEVQISLFFWLTCPKWLGIRKVYDIFELNAHMICPALAESAQALLVLSQAQAQQLYESLAS